MPTDDDEFRHWPLEPVTNEDIDVVSRFLWLQGKIQAGTAIDLDEWEALRSQCLEQRRVGELKGNRNFLRWDRKTLLSRSWMHARAYLHYTDWFSRVHGPPELPIENFRGIDAVAHTPRLLRGHRDYRWHLAASIHRPWIDRRNAESALRAFTIVLRADLALRASRFDDGALPPDSVHAALAMAQHYQLETPLLDWTREPDVAVAFACGRDPLKPGDTPYAAVLMIPIGEAIRLGARIIFPPLFATRLYEQRGLFIEMSEGNEEIVYAACHKIIFPRPPEPVGYYTGLLPDDPYLGALVTWAKGISSLTVPVENLHKEAHAYLRRINVRTPWFLDRIDRESASEFVRVAQRLLDSVAFLNLAEDGPKYHPGVVDAVHRDNPGLLEWLAKNGGRVV